MTLEQFLSSIFQVATALVLTTWAIVGVAVSSYYAYKTAQNLITRREKMLGKLKKSKMFSLYDRKGQVLEARKVAKAK